ncbi:hypothetical protein JD844_012812 [Phrynosoma platyrhinos]|uniref:Uncharacterized protein n=1 Tax=Phrynosoma platyrhinos TaxID=52577 RepID=A0ABQ7TKX9_PHRPL|nr:hypothetical protein JD844_012812 [Phrynosoma platyrhinos]
MRRLLTTQEQDGWRELVNKEAFCRISWKAKYGSKYPQQVPNYRISQKKCFLPAIRSPDDSGNSSPCEEITVQKEEGKKLPERENDATLQEPLPEMRAPTPETVQLLYQGFSRDAVKDIRTPIYGKSRIVKDTFYFKNGIFYHPSKTDKLS